MLANDAKGIQERTPSATEIIRLFFAIAEKFRVAGQEFFSVGQEKMQRSLLDPNTSWSIPEGFDLPVVDLKIPKLTDEELEWAGVLSR